MKTSNFENQLVESTKALETFAYSLTLNQDDAKDLVQDTFLKALLNKDSFEEGSNLKAWLFTIMKNTFINNYRKNKKIQSTIAKEQEIPWINNLPADKIYNSDHNTNLQQVLLFINQLPEEQKNAFEMTNQGFKYDEIADFYDIPIGTVKSRIFFARKKLMNMCQ